MNELNFSINLTEEQYFILTQWYRQAMIIEGIHAGARKSDELFQKIDTSYQKKKSFHEKHKNGDSVIYGLLHHAERLNW